jgi:hypothetical protein
VGGGHRSARHNHFWAACPPISARRDLFQALAGCFAVLGVVAVVVFVRSNKEPIPLAVSLGNGMLLAVLVILAAWQGYHITRKGVHRRGGTPPRPG